MTDTTQTAAAATLMHKDTELSLPVVPAVEGNNGLDISALMKSTGDVTLDVGFVNTASCQSDITYIDGDAGILRYRGYPIEQLAENSTFLETSYLLIHGELPDAAELEEYDHTLRRHTLLLEDMKQFFDGFHQDAHPMSVLASAVSALGTFYQDNLNPHDARARDLSAIRLMAKLPTIASYAFRKSQGKALLYPNNDYNLVENFLWMTFGQPTEPYQLDPLQAKALDQLFILHADHEQNCSTSTVRLVGSSEANMFAAISAGIHALSGPLHGGANSAVLSMLETIRTEGGDVKEFVRKVKDKEDGVKLMGFGHRVYKNYDPRAAIVKKTAHDMFAQSGSNELLDLALQLEEHALEDDYFVERKLYPNVDFYTGLIYESLGFPSNMFTVLFALGRLPGWIAQYKEMITDPATKIGRPRQVYTGPEARDYAPVDQRG